MSASLEAGASGWRLDSGTNEALKWLAFACMLVDHANTILYGRDVAWMYDVGRVAMPVFALVFGINLARARDLRAVAWRLTVVGALVHPLVIATVNRGEVWPLNILLTFAVAAWLAVALDTRRVWSALALVAVGAIFVDYSLPGVLLVLSARGLARGGRALYWEALAVGAIAGVCLLNGNAWALLGAALIVGAGWVHIPCPRSRWLLLAAYPAHLLVLVAIPAWAAPVSVARERGADSQFRDVIFPCVARPIVPGLRCRIRGSDTLGVLVVRSRASDG